MKIIQVKSDGKGGAIYSAPNLDQAIKIAEIINKANEKLEKLISEYRI